MPRHPRPTRHPLAVLAAILLAAGCAQREQRPVDSRPDPHSFSDPAAVVVEHVDLDLDVDFDARRLRGRASLTIDNHSRGRQLVLDTWGLDVRGVTLGESRRPTGFEPGDEVAHLGRPLTVSIEPDTRLVHVDYETGPDAIALQWLDPGQTAGGRRPFLLTQSETVFARTWIPCQDSPAARVTYAATVRTPSGLTALMSAVNPTDPPVDGTHRFEMPYAIPPYLIALVVGELAFRPLGERTGVWAEPPVIERAAHEFAGTERMLETAEALYGSYRWGRYDLVVLPKGFPFGGMENPRLTFVTPTLIAGDRSLVSTIAHEIAHSWSGNLVATATWGDIWLNEGLTTYIERRIMERLHGAPLVDMIAFVDQRGLRDELAELGPDSPDTHLRLNLSGRDPEEAFGDVPYEKGYLFFRMLEETVGREAWDRFLRDTFDDLAFSSIDTDRFLKRLRERLLAGRADAAALDARIRRWVDGPGLPDGGPSIDDSGLRAVDDELRAWAAGEVAAPDTSGWTTHHWLYFLRNLPDDLAASRLEELDARFRLTDSRNAAVLQAWLLQAVAREYAPAEAALDRFLTTVGRLLFIGPLYRELAKSPRGLERAREIYERARDGYHAVARREIEGILDGPEEP